MFFIEGEDAGVEKPFPLTREPWHPLLTGPPNFHKSTLAPGRFNTPFPILVVPVIEETRIGEERFKLIRDDTIHARRGSLPSCERKTSILSDVARQAKMFFPQLFKLSSLISEIMIDWNEKEQSKLSFLELFLLESSFIL